MKIISLNDIKNWICKSESLYSLQSIRAKTNKRIKTITTKGGISQISPFSHIPIEQKREILKDLFVEPTQSVESKKKPELKYCIR